jgi:hypothetical protein
MEIAAEIFQIEPNVNGDQRVNNAQLVAVKRALKGLRRKGIVHSHTVNRSRGHALAWSHAADASRSESAANALEVC